MKYIKDIMDYFNFKMNLKCNSKCSICCRYAEFLPEEIFNAADKSVLGVRINFLPRPKYFSFHRILPKFEDHFINIIIIECGYRTMFEQLCSWYGGHNICHFPSGKPLLCQARPFDILLPDYMQCELLSTMLKCGTENISQGVPIIKSFLLSHKLLGKRGKAFYKCREKRVDDFELFKHIVDLFLDEENSKVDILRSGVSKQVYLILPISIVVQAMYDLNRLTLQESLDILEKQKQKLTEDLNIFLEKYGENKEFTPFKMFDGTIIYPNRGMYLERITSWLSDYDSSILTLKENLISYY